MKTLLKKSIASLVAVSLAMPAGAATPLSTFSWTPASELASAQTGDGSTTQYGYNAHGELVQETWPAGFGTLSYGRDARGDISSVQDPRGVTTSYARNTFSEVTQQVSPDSGTEGYTRDGAGNVTSRALPGGGVASYSYDAANRLTSANSGDEAASFGYDAGATGKGRLTSMQDATGATEWTYNAAGAVTSKSQTTSGTTLTVQYGYSNGRLAQLTYPSGAVVTFGFDAERVSSIAVNGVTRVSGIQYLPFGPSTGWQMGSVGTYSRTFDTAGRLSSYTYEEGVRQLEWDAANRLTSVQNPDGSVWAYGYDELGRLRSASEGTQGTQLFGLDATGNRTSWTLNGAAYAYAVDGTSNRLNSAAGPTQAQSLQYDAAGRVLTDGTRSYTWTAAGRLATAAMGASTTAYGYNGQGQRVLKTSSSGPRYYMYAEDGVSLLGEYGAQGATAPLYEVVYLEGTPVMVLAGGQVYYVQADHLNAPRTVKNTSGAVVWRWASDARNLLFKIWGPGLGAGCFGTQPRAHRQQQPVRRLIENSFCSWATEGVF